MANNIVDIPDKKKLTEQICQALTYGRNYKKLCLQVGNDKYIYDLDIDNYNDIIKINYTINQKKTTTNIVISAYDIGEWIYNKLLNSEFKSFE